MQARVSVAAGRRLRQQLDQSASLREILDHPVALTARRTAARTARQLAPKAADRFIADLKGTEPLLASVRAERRTTAPGRRRSTLQLAATLSAAAVVGGLLAGPAAVAAAPAIGDRTVSTAPVAPLGSITEPQVYPRPQQLVAAGEAVSVPDTVGLVTAGHADASAVAAVRRVLGIAGATDIIGADPSAAPVAGSLVVYVGGPAEGAGGDTDRVLRQLAAAGGRAASDLSPAGLPSGGYVLAAGRLPAAGGGTYGAVVLAGVDATGTFYAAQSLRQLLAPIAAGQGQAAAAAGRGLPGVLMRDWPTGAPVRGTAESFYGTPWTTGERLDQLDFLGSTKQNFFLYAPGADPYRTARWREAYPAAQADALRRLAERARDNHVVLGYSIDPGQSFCYSSGKDVDALVAKLDGLRRLGFGAFQLQFLDVSYEEWHCPGDRRTFGTGPAAAAKAQGALAAEVQRRLIAAHPELAPLTVVPTEYQKQGATPYRSALAAALPAGVQVAWSGGSVIAAEVTGSGLAETAGLFGRPLVTMDNYPVNDSTPDRLFLGGYTGRDPAVATRSAALLTSAMTQPVASRLPLATAADFGWKPDGYRVADSVRAAVHLVAGGDAGARAALTALAGNSASSPLDGRESGYLVPLLERFWAALEPSSGGAPDQARLQEAAEPVRAAFATMAGAPAALAAEPVAEDAGPWLERLAAYGRAGQAALTMLMAQRSGDGSAAWQARVGLRELREELAHGTVTVGGGVLDGFLERALRDADTWAGSGAGTPVPTTTIGTANDHVPGLMTDGAADTFYWSAEPPHTGDAVGLDLGAGRPLGRVTVLMGSWGDGPDAASAADDYLRDGVLEYTTGSGGWRQLALVQGRKSVSVSAPAGTVAKAVRLRAVTGQKTAVAVREFSVTAPDDNPAVVTGPAAAPGSSADAVLDGDPDTAFRAADAPTVASEPLTVELGAARPLDRVTVLTDPTVLATATVSVRGADGGWTPIGDLKPGYNELAAGGRAVDAIRLVWAPGLQAPVVNQIVPWYADAPAAQLNLSDGSVDVVSGQAVPVITKAVLESGRPEGTSGELKVEVPAVARGLTVTQGSAVAVPRGSRVGVPLKVAAAADTPSGTYRVPVTFTAGTLTLRQELEVHVVPPTGGQDLARLATATSSADRTPEYPAARINDGDPQTRWSSPPVAGSWIRLELPQAVRLGSAVLHWHEDAYASAYRLESSSDGVTWTTVAAVEDGRGGVETVRFDAPNTRFLRMQGVTRGTQYGYSLWGVEVYAVTG
ncbi:beta-N-acetylglucosaminidase domain-containing protein [Kitasatospora sp. NBC_01539]|uniref:beta-N-acetylglucosaminidase domain-containing protein n=1 Tax=Kitasatospora sp. NBC_01539 TaxID=2903577 RepID=UPI0038600B59